MDEEEQLVIEETMKILRSMKETPDTEKDMKIL